LCKLDETIQLGPLPNDVREKCIKKIVHDKKKGFVFFEILNPSGKLEESETVCVRGKSVQRELPQCTYPPPMRKSDVDQTLEIVSNELCFGEGQTDDSTGKSDNSTQVASGGGILGEGGVIALCILIGFLVLGAVSATTFCLWKRRQKSQNKENEVIDEDENPVYGLYQVHDGEVEYTTAEAIDTNDVYGE